MSQINEDTVIILDIPLCSGSENFATFNINKTHLHMFSKTEMDDEFIAFITPYINRLNGGVKHTPNISYKKMTSFKILDPSPDKINKEQEIMGTESRIKITINISFIYDVIYKGDLVMVRDGVLIHPPIKDLDIYYDKNIYTDKCIIARASDVRWGSLNISPIKESIITHNAPFTCILSGLARTHSTQITGVVNRILSHYNSIKSNYHNLPTYSPENGSTKLGFDALESQLSDTENTLITFVPLEGCVYLHKTSTNSIVTSVYDSLLSLLSNIEHKLKLMHLIISHRSEITNVSALGL